MFSSRSQWNSRPNPLTELLNEKLREGAPVLDLTESNPTRALLEYPEEQILAAAFDKRVLDYEPDPRGLLSAREAVVEYYAERGVAVDPVQILLTASTSEAYSYIFKLLAEPGDEILVPQPSYPLFEYLAAMESVRVQPYSLRYDGAWHVDFDALEFAISPRTRAIIVVNPNNPTGSFLKREEHQRLDSLAAAHGIAILSDEVFSDYGFDADPQRVETLIGDTRALTFTMSGLSKVTGLPQMKLGWIVASGPAREQALDGLEWIADTFLSVATPVQVALPRLLKAGAAVREQIQERTRANLSFLLDSVGDDSPCQVLDVEGGWYATLQVPRTRSEEEWALHLLRDYDVRVQPGFFYDFPGEAYLVLSLLTEPTVFQEGVERVLSAMASLR